MNSSLCRLALLAAGLVLPAAPVVAAPAVRAGDRTSHGGVVSASVSPNVFVEGQPAARGEDRVVCPLSTGAVPHVGGSILVGARTVFINGRPAVRTGDTVAEVGPTSVIVTGAATVNVGP